MGLYRKCQLILASNARQVLPLEKKPSVCVFGWWWWGGVGVSKTEWRETERKRAMGRMRKSLKEP